MILYDSLEKAFDFYNRNLFKSKLPEVVFSIENRNNIKGFFSSSCFMNSNSKKVSKITLNSVYFEKGKEKAVLSTLVHEMCHLMMFMEGEKCTAGYHSKKWAELMCSIGLIPTDNGKKDGKMTGFTMTHYIEKGGKFDLFTEKLLNGGFKFNVINAKENSFDAAEKKHSLRGKRYLYKCGCSSFWGRKGLKVSCLSCNKMFICSEE